MVSGCHSSKTYLRRDERGKKRMNGALGLCVSLSDEADVDQTLRHEPCQTTAEVTLFAYSAFTAGAVFFAHQRESSEQQLSVTGQDKPPYRNRAVSNRHAGGRFPSRASGRDGWALPPAHPQPPAGPAAGLTRDGRAGPGAPGQREAHPDSPRRDQPHHAGP